MKRGIATIIAAVLVISTIAGCGGSGNSKQEESAAPEAAADEAAEPEGEAPAETAGTTFGIEPMENEITLSLGYFSGAMHALPWYIMEQEGWIEELGISFEYQSFINGPAMMEANADWDIASTGGPGAITGILGYDIKVMGIADKEAVLNLYVREDSPIYQAGQGNFPDYPKMYGTVDTWKGTEWLIPVGTTMHQTLVTILEQIGLTADDVTMTNMDVTTALTAFKTGAGDGLAVWTSTAIEAEQEGYIKVAGADDNGVIVPTTILATDAALADPEKYEAICKCWELYYRAIDFILADREKAAEYYAETCSIEGVSGADDYDLCYESLSRFMPYGLEDELELMNTYAEDPKGTAGRELSNGEIDLFNTLDFFISQDKYTEDDRNSIIDNEKVTSVIAKAVQESVSNR